MEPFKIATMLFTWNGIGDRFVRSYSEATPPARVFAQLRGTLIQGVELQHPNHVSDENVDQLRAELDTNALEVAVVNIPMAANPAWARGTFTHPSPEVRAQSVERVKRALDVSRRLGVRRASIFLGQDGFDYPLASDHRNTWDRLLQCFDECAAHAPDVRLCIEYKHREPRSRQHLGTAAKTLLLAEELGRPNVGLLVDVGHVWMALESAADVIALAARKRRLFHIHFNDNFVNADDDLGVGAVHLPEILEALYWLHEVDYDGWLSLDVHSPREEPFEVIRASAELLSAIDGYLVAGGMDRVRQVIASGDGSVVLRFLVEWLRIPSR